jgi:hypothetical protein
MDEIFMRPFTLILRPALGMALLTTLLGPVSLAQIYEYDLPTAPKPAVSSPSANPPSTHVDATTPNRTQAPPPSLNTAMPDPIVPAKSDASGPAAVNHESAAPQAANPPNTVFEDLFYSVNKPTPPQSTAPTDIKTPKNETDTSKATPKSARLKKQNWRAMNLGDHKEQAIQQELQRLKQEREFDQQQISKNSEALTKVTDDLEKLQAQRQALLDQITILAGKTPETKDRKGTAK